MPEDANRSGEVAAYYDDYTERQTMVGTNARHRAVRRWLRRFGLASGMDVLEIGCGVGTVTELIARELKGSGTLIAVDLSPASVNLARDRVARYQNVSVLPGDATELNLDARFDVVVLPDVVEHVPLVQHPKLFANVHRWLKDDGWALVHMPNPFYLAWCHQHRRDLLQVVDQPIFTDTLVENIGSTGLYIHHLETYSVFVPECDYQVVVLKRTEAMTDFTIDAKPSMRSRLGDRLRRLR